MAVIVAVIVAMAVVLIMVVIVIMAVVVVRHGGPFDGDGRWKSSTGSARRHHASRRPSRKLVSMVAWPLMAIGPRGVRR